MLQMGLRDGTSRGCVENSESSAKASIEMISVIFCLKRECNEVLEMLFHSHLRGIYSQVGQGLNLLVRKECKCCID